MKNAVFLDVGQCGFIINRRFGGTRVASFTMKMETARSSETPVYNEPTRRHIPEGGILQKYGNYASSTQQLSVLTVTTAYCRRFSFIQSTNASGKDCRRTGHTQ
jgi:hypothetical protein